MSCLSHPIFGAVKEDLTTSKFSQYLPLRWSSPDLRAAPEFSPAPVKTGLLLPQEEKDVCPTWLAPGGREGYLRHCFRILSPQLGAFESVTKCLRPLSLRFQRRRRLSLLRISLRGKIVGVILYWWGIVPPVWLIQTILAGSSSLSCVVFPKWSLLAPQILDSKARSVAPTVLLLHKGNYKSLPCLLSEGSSAVLFSPFWLEQSHYFQLGTWRWTCGRRKRMVQVKAWRLSSHASLSFSFLPIVHWFGNVRLFDILMLKWAGWAACPME